MKITVNGHSEEIADDTSILTFLDQRGVTVEHVVVELNTKIIKKEVFQKTMLNDGDSVEILELVGGG